MLQYRNIVNNRKFCWENNYRQFRKFILFRTSHHFFLYILNIYYEVLGLAEKKIDFKDLSAGRRAGKKYGK